MMIMATKVLFALSLVVTLVLIQKTEANVDGLEAPPTEQCKDETKHIMDTADKTLRKDYYVILHENVKGRVRSEDDCNYTSNFEFECNIIFEANNETMEHFTKLCEGAEGKIAQRTVALTSNFLLAWTFDVSISNVPQCVGISCPDQLYSDQLKDPVLDLFVGHLQEGDICDASKGQWGAVEFWTAFAFDVAYYGGMDMGDCFSDASSTDGTTSTEGTSTEGTSTTTSFNNGREANGTPSIFTSTKSTGGGNISTSLKGDDDEETSDRSTGGGNNSTSLKGADDDKTSDRSTRGGNNSTSLKDADDEDTERKRSLRGLLYSDLNEDILLSDSDQDILLIDVFDGPEAT